MLLKAALILTLGLHATSCLAHGSAARLEAERRARAHAAFLASIPQKNAAQLQRYDRVLERSRSVKLPTTRGTPDAGYGPAAALYVSLNTYTPQGSFADYRQQGWAQLRKLDDTAGMSSPALMRGLQRLRLVGEDQLHPRAYDRAVAAAWATWRNHVVFLEVSAPNSYQAIRGIAPPAYVQGRQVVSLAATILDERGNLDKVGVYDSNVYNSTTSKDIGVRFVSLGDLAGMLAPDPESRMSSTVVTSMPIWDRFPATTPVKSGGTK